MGVDDLDGDVARRVLAATSPCVEEAKNQIASTN
jgi:hypothetical protein